MSILPIRKLGQFGVITDVDPFDIAPNAWTMGVNVRFEDNSIHRGPVANLAGTLENANPEYVVSFNEIGGVPMFFVCNEDGTIQSWAQGTPGGSSTQTDITASGWSASNNQQAYTACILNDLVYVNRPDREPWYWSPSASAFAPLTNWPSGWLCKSLREFSGQLIALNVQQGSDNYPTMIAWSDVTTWGTVPDTWVATDTNLAGNNVLDDLGDALVDGASMYSFFVLYSQNETWIMTPTGTVTEVFNFNRLFGSPMGSPFQRGVISQNCIVAHDNVHYVFGPNTIWLNNGYGALDLCAGRTRKFIYNNMVKAQSSQFFVVHQPRLDEIMFCYVSVDPYCAFPVGGNIGYPGCNRAAVYNYRADTWYFYDLPYATAAGVAPPVQATTYAELSTVGYSSIGGSYTTYADDALLSLMLVAPTVSLASLVASAYSFEVPDSPASNGVYAPSASPQSYLEKQSIDLDEVGAELRGYKVVKSIYPEGRFDPGAAPLSFSFAGADYSNQEFTYGSPMTFDGSTDYKLDYQTPGRYLSMLVTFADFHDFTLSSLDLDATITGSR